MPRDSLSSTLAKIVQNSLHFQGAGGREMSLALPSLLSCTPKWFFCHTPCPESWHLS